MTRSGRPATPNGSQRPAWRYNMAAPRRRTAPRSGCEVCRGQRDYALLRSPAAILRASEVRRLGHEDSQLQARHIGKRLHPQVEARLTMRALWLAVVNPLRSAWSPTLRSHTSLEMLPAVAGLRRATSLCRSKGGSGLTTACFAHCARPSCAPLAAPPLCPHWAYFALLRAQRALRGPFPFGKKEAFGSATSYDSATIQKAPLCKGSCQRS